MYSAQNFTKKPPQKVYDAANKLPLEYLSPAQTLEGLKAPLVAGYPVASVFSVFTSFEPQVKAETFDFSMPRDDEEAVGNMLSSSSASTIKRRNSR